MRSYGGFDGVIALYEQLVSAPDQEATGDALYPGWNQPAQAWAPDLGAITPYVAVSPETLALDGFGDFHAIPEDRLKAAIERTVAVEGPVHFEVLADRLLNAADVGRLGRRIRERIQTILDALAQAGRLEQAGPFAGTPAQYRQPRYRDWSEAPEKTRVLDYVSDAELKTVLFRAVLANAPVAPEQAMNDGLAVIGFPRLTEAAQTRLAEPLNALCAAECLETKTDVLHPGRQAFQRRRESPERHSDDHSGN